jgi:quaternary ammonium compound-resistance protein SugE
MTPQQKLRMGWIILAIAGVLEVTWAICLKKSEGFTRFPWGLIAILLSVASVVLLALALRTIPLGTGYAIWTGIGAAGTAILGIWLFQESHSPLRLLFIVLILISIVGLRLTAK